MNKRILIVEDEQVVALDLQVILERAGYQICGIAASFEEAIAIAAVEQPDLALIDIFLKGKLTGIHVARELQKVNLPFVYLSANKDQKVLEAAFTTQPHGFLVKPFREKELLLALDVARYRHRDILQFDLLKLDHLQDKLEAVRDSLSGREDKLVNIAKVLETYVPFDLLTMSFEEKEPSSFYAWAFLKEGYERYKIINVAGFQESMGLEPGELLRLYKDQPTQSVVSCYNADDFMEITLKFPVKLKITEIFGMRSNLNLPLNYSEQTLVLGFFSRKEVGYQEKHKHFLIHLQDTLGAVLKTVIAKDFMPVPYSDLEENEYFTENTSNYPGFGGIIGSCPKITSVFDQIKQVAPFNTPVLITGDTGTGKEKTAHLIHKLSLRHQEPFVIIDCTAMADPLIEFELFGYEKETYDGKLEYHVGKLEAADGGTLFFDEIAAMPRNLQLKILQMIQKKAIQRIGSTELRKVSLRLIVATNYQLQREIAKGRFSLDLYFRLNVFPIRLPLLHERKEDALLLAQYFAEEISRDMAKPYTGLSEKMKAELLNYHWPGNIRELKNVIEHSIILNEGREPLEIRRQLEGGNIIR